MPATYGPMGSMDDPWEVILRRMLHRMARRMVRRMVRRKQRRLRPRTCRAGLRTHVQHERVQVKTRGAACKLRVCGSSLASICHGLQCDLLLHTGSMASLMTPGSATESTLPNNNFF